MIRVTCDHCGFGLESKKQMFEIQFIGDSCFMVHEFERIYYAEKDEISKKKHLCRECLEHFGGSIKEEKESSANAISAEPCADNPLSGHIE